MDFEINLKFGKNGIFFALIILLKLTRGQIGRIIVYIRYFFGSYL